MRIPYSYLPFYCNFQEKQFLKEILGRKSPCIMIRSKFRTLSNISQGAFAVIYSENLFLTMAVPIK